MRPDRLSISALRARNLPRLRLLRPPTTYLELHFLPGGIPAVTTPSISGTDPIWRGFSFTHTTSLCGSVPFALVLREASGEVLGRVQIDVDASLVEGWYGLQGGGDVYVRIVRNDFCVRWKEICGLSEGWEGLEPGKGGGKEGELREVKRDVGCLFRVGELVVKVEAFVPEGAKELMVVLKTEEQMVRGGEVREQEEVVGEEEEKEEEGEGDDEAKDEGEEEEGGIREVKKSGSRAKALFIGGGRKMVKSGGKKVVKVGLKNVGNRQEVGRSNYVEALAPGRELQRLMKVAGSYAMSLKERGADTNGAFHGVAKEDVGKGDIENNDSRSKEFANVDVAKDTEVKAVEHEGDGVLALPGYVEKGSGNEGEPEEKETREHEMQKMGENGAGGGGGEGDGEDEVKEKKEKDDEEDEDDSDSDTMVNVVEASVITNDVHAPVARKPKRSADCGMFRFALFQGYMPGMMDVLIQDTVSPFPAPLGLLQEHIVRMPKLSDFTCACAKQCNTHMFRFRLSGSGPGSATLQLCIYYRRWAPLATSNDVTDRFREVFAYTNELPNVLRTAFPIANDLTYLFVGGFFTQHYPNYYEKNIKYLKEKLQLARVETVPIHTEGSIERNAKVICDSIMKTCRGKKSVVLIGHSKGGVDAVSVLHKFPEVVPYIYGIIAFQAPFGGTFLIDYVSRSRIAVSTISNAIETILKGDQAAFLDMGYAARLAALGLCESDVHSESRKEVMATAALDNNDDEAPQQSPVLDALKTVPIIAFASSASFDVLKIRSAADVAGLASMAPAAQIITQNTGFACDGLVTPADARVPYADVVVLDDMLHTEPALYVKGTKYHPGQLTASALLLLFEKASRRP